MARLIRASLRTPKMTAGAVRWVLPAAALAASIRSMPFKGNGRIHVMRREEG